MKWAKTFTWCLLLNFKVVYRDHLTQLFPFTWDFVVKGQRLVWGQVGQNEHGSAQQATLIQMFHKFWYIITVEAKIMTRMTGWWFLILTYPDTFVQVCLRQLCLFFPAALTNSYPSRLPTRPGPAYCEIMDLVIICVCACISSSDHAILHHRSTGEKHRPLKRKQSFWVVPGRKGL